MNNVREDDERIERERFLSDNTGTEEPESHWLCSPDMSINHRHSSDSCGRLAQIARHSLSVIPQLRWTSCRTVKRPASGTMTFACSCTCGRGHKADLYNISWAGLYHFTSAMY